MKRIIFITILFVCTISIVNSIHAIYSLIEKKKVLIQAQQQLVKAQQENKNLKKQLQIVSSQTFVEEEARNKLFLVKPGENTVFIAKDLLATNSAAVIQKSEATNWQKWLDIFFH